jgi:hypothetical protein
MVEPDQRLPCFVEFTHDDARDTVVYALAFSPSLSQVLDTERGVNRARPPLPNSGFDLGTGHPLFLNGKENTKKLGHPPGCLGVVRVLGGVVCRRIWA